MDRKDAQAKVVRHVLYRGKIIPYTELPLPLFDRNTQVIETKPPADPAPVTTGTEEAADDTADFAVATEATRAPVASEPDEAGEEPATEINEGVTNGDQPRADPTPVAKENTGRRGRGRPPRARG